jgi:hypothetical protein
MRPSSIASRKLVVGQSGSSIPTSRKVVAHVLLREMQCPQRPWLRSIEGSVARDWVHLVSTYPGMTVRSPGSITVAETGRTTTAALFSNAAVLDEDFGQAGERAV